MDRTLTINNKYIGEDNYAYRSFDKLVLGENVEGIEDRTFCGCTMLSHISFNHHLAYLGELAFAYCEQLKEVRLPSSFQSLGEKAFYHTPLEHLELDGIRSIDAEALSYTHLKELILPKSLECFSLKQEIYTLKGIYYLGSEEEWHEIELEDTDGPHSLLNHVDIYFYDETRSKKGFYFYFDKGHIVTEDDLVTPTPNLVYEVDKEGFYTLVDAHKATSKKIILDPRTQVIKSHAFEEMTMNTVIVPKGVLKIESLAFFECCYLQDIVNITTVKRLERDSLLSTIIDRTPFLTYRLEDYKHIFGDTEGYRTPEPDFKDYTLFNEESKGASLTIKGSHLYIGEATYSYQEFNEVTIEGDDIVMGARAFYGCTIKALNIKGTHINIGYQAFALADISTFNEDTKDSYFSSQAFYHVTNLKYLEIKGNDNFISLGSECFSYCVDLERLYLESYSNNVMADAFDNCIKLRILECSKELDIMFDFNNCFALEVVAGTYHFDGHVMGGIMAYNLPDYILIPTTGYRFDTINNKDWINHCYYYSPTYKEGHFYYIKDNQVYDWATQSVIMDNIHFTINHKGEE